MLAIMETLAKQKPTDPDIALNLAIAREKAGDAALADGKLDEARRHFDASLKVLQGATDVWGREGLKQRYVCSAHIKIGTLARQEAKRVEAVDSFVKALDACEAWLALDPASAERAKAIDQVKRLIKDASDTAQ